MVTLRTPEAPATSKQLWLLHVLTKTDTRNLNITMQQAWDRIAEFKQPSAKQSPPSNKGKDLHYCVMYSCEPSKHRMSNGKRKWKAFYTTKDKRLATKQYNDELARMQHNPSLYPTSHIVIVECKAAVFAKSMLLSGLTEYHGTKTGQLYAQIVKDSRQG